MFTVIFDKCAHSFSSLVLLFRHEAMASGMMVIQEVIRAQRRPLLQLIHKACVPSALGCWAHSYACFRQVSANNLSNRTCNRSLVLIVEQTKARESWSRRSLRTLSSPPNKQSRSDASTSLPSFPTPRSAAICRFGYPTIFKGFTIWQAYQSLPLRSRATPQWPTLAIAA